MNYPKHIIQMLKKVTTINKDQIPKHLRPDVNTAIYINEYGVPFTGPDYIEHSWVAHQRIKDAVKSGEIK